MSENPYSAWLERPDTYLFWRAEASNHLPPCPPSSSFPAISFLGIPNLSEPRFTQHIIDGSFVRIRQDSICVLNESELRVGGGTIRAVICIPAMLVRVESYGQCTVPIPNLRDGGRLGEIEQSAAPIRDQCVSPDSSLDRLCISATTYYKLSFCTSLKTLCRSLSVSSNTGSLFERNGSGSSSEPVVSSSGSRNGGRPSGVRAN